MPKLIVSTICSWFVIILSAVTLAGWQFDLIVLRRLLSNAPQTMPLTALMMLTLGVGLIVAGSVQKNAGEDTVGDNAIQRRGPRWGSILVWLGGGLSGVVVLVSCWIIAQYLFHLGPDIELVLYTERVLAQGGDFPGRPSPHTALSCLLIGLAIGFALSSDPRNQRITRILGVVGLAIPWLALYGYASLTILFYQLPNSPETGISPLTAIGVLLLSLGVIWLRPTEGLPALLIERSPGGQIVRRLLPFALIIPLPLSLVVTFSGSAGLVTSPLGLGLSWGVMSLGLAGLIIYHGFNLSSYDRQLRQAIVERDAVVVDLKSAADQIDQYNQELQQRTIALEKSNKALDRFASIASHDLQEPLMSLSVLIQSLQDTYQGQLDEQGDDWINQALDSARRMQNLIYAILAYARLDSRARPFKAIPLNHVLSEAMDMLAASIEQSNAVVTSDELPTVQGDRTQLAQLLFNLIGNGIKYNDCHPPKIHISAEPQPNSWRIAVRDNGIGIDPKNQKHIFEISHRLHTQSEYPGTGLGLAICSRVVERHGGRIWVESQLDQGSTFYFELPVKQAK